MATRSDRIAQVVHDAALAALARQRHEVAAERRRLLTHALHSTAAANEDLGSGEVALSDAPLEAVTDRFQRVELEAAVTDRFHRVDLEATVTGRFHRVDLVDIAEPEVEAGHVEARMSLGDRVALLREQAAACRAQAIALNAKLVLLQAAHARLPQQSGELQAARDVLIESSARLDHAVEEIGAVTSVEQQLADSLR